MEKSGGHRRVRRTAAIFLTAGVVSAALGHPAWAASVGDNPFELIDKFIGTFYMQIMSAATGLAILLITAALIKKMVATSPQARSACVSWIVGIVTCWFFIMTLGAWYGWIEPMVSDNSYTPETYFSETMEETRA
ncbi:MAG: hypothetical protein Q4C55_09030 [Eubacterium sp.]|nr:hypothetical protein [Eubacterium sp.]